MNRLTPSWESCRTLSPYPAPRGLRKEDPSCRQSSNHHSKHALNCETASPKTAGLDRANIVAPGPEGQEGSIPSCAVLGTASHQALPCFHGMHCFLHSSTGKQARDRERRLLTSVMFLMAHHGDAGRRRNSHQCDTILASI